MKYVLTSAALVFFSSTVSAGSVTVRKNELTNEKQYTYSTMATNSDKWMLQVGCNSSGTLYFTAVSAIYGFGIDSDYHHQFDYKFDNSKIELWGTPNEEINQMSADQIEVSVKKWSDAEPAFVRRMLKHDKLILGAKKPAVTKTPVFNIKDFRAKAKQFSHQCDLVGKAIQPTAIDTKVAKDSNNTSTPHTHGDRSHSHPLPAQGKAHKHGNGATGK